MLIVTAVSHYPKVGDQPGQQKLRQALARADRGEAGAEEVESAAREMTIAAIQEQEQAGLDLVTDGQIRWQDPVTYLAAALDGFELNGLLRWFESNTYYRQPAARGEIRWTRPILLEDWQFAQRQARVPVKAVITGPYTLATLSEAGPWGHRPLTLELASALNQELRVLADAGPVWIQIDEPAISSNPSVRYPRDFDLFGEAMKALTEGVEAELSLYIYHGHAADIPGLLELPFALFGLDFVQGGANWRLLESWPRGTGLGMGIVDARNVHLEDRRELAASIARARDAVGEGDLHVSPSCGLEFLPRDVARRKLDLLAQVVKSEL
jgi:5-methyltetrahydropteroyltriglutamate--homocysteine methyltransferase